MRKTIIGLTLFTTFNVNAAIINSGNFSFEDYSVAAGTSVHITEADSKAKPGITNTRWVPGTSSSPVEFLEIRNNSFGTGIDGGNFAEISPDMPSGFRQTFSVDETTEFGSVSWYYAPRFVHGVHNDYSVSITTSTETLWSNTYTDAGVAGDFVTSSIDGIGKIGDWEYLTSATDQLLTFEAGTTYLLKFNSHSPATDINGVALANAHLGANFDNISLSVSAVPEPETYAMFLVGLGLLGFASRKRKV